MPLTPFTYEMNAKLKKEGLQSLLRFMPFWHIDEKKRQLADVNT
jgi:hypothetical protein